ncbi:hypothetical protein K461DRAFT_316402 [Myriangium duriaei CBS 260.36]|uniref:Uncharacterized protein n=1 Tax=Myriangium duriaei CBS 260.36 TaxID=1168546 RepID=A0A9P4MBT3_9PEZI|nr:hypothetical protein K461DRAFT_316402 [Myriangium duriaei CBS 260.36]
MPNLCDLVHSHRHFLCGHVSIDPDRRVLVRPHSYERACSGDNVGGDCPTCVEEKFSHRHRQHHRHRRGPSKEALDFVLGRHGRQHGHRHHHGRDPYDQREIAHEGVSGEPDAPSRKLEKVEEAEPVVETQPAMTDTSPIAAAEEPSKMENGHALVVEEPSTATLGEPPSAEESATATGDISAAQEPPAVGDTPAREAHSSVEEHPFKGQPLPETPPAVVIKLAHLEEKLDEVKDNLVESKDSVAQEAGNVDDAMSEVHTRVDIVAAPSVK